MKDLDEVSGLEDKYLMHPLKPAEVRQVLRLVTFKDAKLLFCLLLELLRRKDRFRLCRKIFDGIRDYIKG